MNERGQASTVENIALQFRQFYFGGNWTFVNVKDTLEQVDYRTALSKVRDFNTIATLAFHIHYYVEGVTDVLEGKPLLIKDKFSFDHPPIQEEKDWMNFKKRMYEGGEKFCQLIEKLNDEDLNRDIDKPVYGSMYRNLCGIIEHGHYHLGQIVLLKRMISAKAIGK